MDHHLSNPGCPVSESLCFILRISQKLGIAPLKFVRVKKVWYARESPMINLYGKVLSTVLCTLATAGLVMDQCVEPQKSLFRSLSARGFHIFDTLIVVFTMMTATFNAGSRMTRLVQCLNVIHKVNEDFASYEEGYNHSQKLNRTVLWIKFIGILANIFYMYNFMKYSYIHAGPSRTMISSMIIFYLIEYSAQFVLEAQLILISSTALSTLKRLNKCFENVLHKMKLDVRNSKVVISEEKRLMVPLLSINTVIDSMSLYGDTYQYGVTGYDPTYERAVLHLVSLHDSLCDVVIQIDKSQGMIVMYLMISCLIHLTSKAYFIILTILSTEPLYSGPSISQFFWGTFNLTRLLLIVEPSHQIQENMNRTGALLMEMTQTIDQNNLFISKEFKNRISLSRAIYKPLHMFTLNRSLLITMFSTIVTYLVVVINY